MLPLSTGCMVMVRHYVQLRGGVDDENMNAMKMVATPP